MAGYRVFEMNAHRACIDEIVQQLLHCASCVAALAAAETLPVVARFENSLLCESNDSKQKTLRDSISEKLQAAFAGATFHVQIDEVQA